MTYPALFAACTPGDMGINITTIRKHYLLMVFLLSSKIQYEDFFIVLSCMSLNIEYSDR